MTTTHMVPPSESYAGTRTNTVPPLPEARRRPSWLAGFRRITSSARYVPEVDGIRFVAILAVFVFHLTGDVLRHSGPGYSESLRRNPLFWTTQVLNIGVQLFFVLSGYILALPFVRQYREREPAVSLKRYFLRRVTRLEPPYIVSLILLFCSKVLAGRGTSWALVPHLAASLGYVHNLVYGQPSDINFVAWSLEIEVQFYLLAPLLCFFFFRHPSAWQRRTALVLCCIGCGAAATLLGVSPRAGLSIVAQMPYFLAGLLLADFESSPCGRNQRVAVVWDVACASLILLLFLWLDLGWPMAYAGALTIAGSYWTAFRSRWILSFLRLTGLTTVGGMCYSIYLLHNYVIGFFGQFTERIATNSPFWVRLAVQGCVLGTLVILICGAFYLLVERPCMRPDWPLRLATRGKNVIEKARRVFGWRGEGLADSV